MTVALTTAASLLLELADRLGNSGVIYGGAVLSLWGYPSNDVDILYDPRLIPDSQWGFMRSLSELSHVDIKGIKPKRLDIRFIPAKAADLSTAGLSIVKGGILLPTVSVKFLSRGVIEWVGGPATAYRIEKTLAKLKWKIGPHAEQILARKIHSKLSWLSSPHLHRDLSWFPVAELHIPRREPDVSPAWEPELAEFLRVH